MTELRRRMDDDMLARGVADRTRESYLWAVTGLALGWLVWLRRRRDRARKARLDEGWTVDDVGTDG